MGNPWAARGVAIGVRGGSMGCPWGLRGVQEAFMRCSLTDHGGVREMYVGCPWGGNATSVFSADCS